MQLKEYISIVFQDNILNVFKKGQHIVQQPFNSNTGEQFKDKTEAEQWLFQYYPDLFTPAV
jgi:hypothetical protein